MKQEVHGNLTGIRDSVIDALASLYNYEVEDGDFLPRELMQFLARFTGALNREIAVYITRDGEIVDLATRLDILQKSGSWYSYNGQRIGQGRDKVKQVLRDNPAMAEEIAKKLFLIRFWQR